MSNENLRGKMKDVATMVTCARAGVINEEALRKIKAEKKIRFLNDGYKKDEEGPKSVADMADIMLPHLGASTVEANTNAARRAAEELIELDEEGITSFVVNREVPEGLDEAYGKLAYTITKLCRHLVGANAKLKTIETSFYGSLKPFGDWLMIPIVSALGNAIDDRPTDHKEALQHLKEMGVNVDNRQTDPNKGFENSMTIDLTGSLDSGSLRRVSVRGTVTEGILMIARINDFDKLYFEPKGPTVFFIYEDRPGVLGLIGSALAGANINIEDVRNPHHLKANQSLVIMRVNQPVPDAMMNDIAGKIKAIASHYYDFG
jgi:D-3-phosphoglycerate dehydrogenase